MTRARATPKASNDDSHPRSLADIEYWGLRAAIAAEKKQILSNGTVGGSEPFVPLWLALDDYAEKSGVPPWVVVERQMTHGDALEWVRRRQTKHRARRDAG